MSGEYTPGADIIKRIAAYDCSDGGHCDAVGGSAYDLMSDASDEIKHLRAALTETAAERDRLRAEVERLKDAYQRAEAAEAYLRDAETAKTELVEMIKQVEAVCGDNAGPECNHAMALNFVHSVARAALAKATATEGT